MPSVIRSSLLRFSAWWWFGGVLAVALVFLMADEVVWSSLLPGLVLGALLCFACVRLGSGKSGRLPRDGSAKVSEILHTDQGLEHLSAQVPGVLYVFRRSVDGRYAFPYASAGIREIYGVSPESVREDATEILQRLHPDDVQRIFDSIETSAKELTRWSCEYRVHLPGRGLRWLGGFSQPERQTDGSTLWFGYISDITERKDAEEELRRINRCLEETTQAARKMAEEAQMADKAKSEFLANMSHEIRTPLNGILGMTQLLLDSALTGDQRHFAENVHRCGDALLGLINDILDLSKIEAGKMDLEAIEFDPAHVLADVLATVELRAQEKGIDLLCGVDANVSGRFRGDPGRLRQVFANLLINAVKFTEKGSVVVGGEVLVEERESILLRFSIRDTGIGIPQEQSPGLFEKFTQGDMSITRKYGGTGLGLAISRQLVEMMGGEIGVVSEPGEGSEFWFTVRLGRVEKASDVPATRADAAPAEEGPEIPAKEIGANSRILLVEDNVINRDVALRFLRKLGYAADYVEDGPAALRALAERDYALVLMDVQMPGMDGKEAARLIRDPQSGVRDPSVPIIALTAHAFERDRRESLAAGMNDFLPKPVALPTLGAVIEKWVAVRSKA